MAASALHRSRLRLVGMALALWLAQGGALALGHRLSTGPGETPCAATRQMAALIALEPGFVIIPNCGSAR